jgi:hypothetical protein
MTQLRQLLLVAALVAAGLAMCQPSASADVCMYPGNGMGVNIIFGHGGFCDYPTEINGSHMHCEAGGAGLGGGLGLAGDSGSLGIGGTGIGGASCTWRCPDGVLSPAPNPPGMWRGYMVPMNSTNFCRDHLDPNGFWSEPVLPTEGIAPDGFQPPAVLPPLAPGEPNP